MTKERDTAIGNIAYVNEEPGRRLMIGGSLVFVSMKSSVMPPKGFIAQRPRDAIGGLLGSLKKSAPKLFVYVDEKLLALQKTRFAFAIDSYLSWGLRQKKSKGLFVLMGGVEHDGGEFNVDVLVFENGQLIDLYDRELPARKSIRFVATAESVLNDIYVKYPKARVYQAGPMGDLDLPRLDYIGDKPLKGMSYRPLTVSTSSRGDYLIPAAIGAAGFLFYLAAISSGWSKYSEALARYDEVAADPAIKKQGGVDANYIGVMNQRRFFMEAPRRQDLLPHAALKIVRGIGAVPQVQIIEMRLPSPVVNVQPQVGISMVPTVKNNNDLITAERVPDASIVISVPRGGESAMDQARTVMGIIADRTGMSLRLAHNGWSDEGKRRKFTIEGFIHG